jgi:hypothetical protein
MAQILVVPPTWLFFCYQWLFQLQNFLLHISTKQGSKLAEKQR